MIEPLNTIQLKEYFQRKELPKVLEGEHMKFLDLPFTVDFQFGIIDAEIEKKGLQGVKKSVIAGAAKTRLNEIVSMLEG